MVALYVDKPPSNGSSGIPRETSGAYRHDNPWDDREPFTPAEETELEPVPGHYKYMLGLPF